MSETTKRRLSKESERAVSGALRSLLVPIDLTPITDRVVGRVALLPLADGACVTLSHVVPDNLPASEQRRAERDANKAITEEARHLRRLLPKKVRLETLVTVGSAGSEIAASAAKLKAELIVMGRGGGRPLRDAFLGSTAERVIRQARLPVLAVRRAVRGSYQRPALALDLDPTARQAVRFLLRVMPTPQPWVDVIHAFDTPFRGLIYPSLSEDEAEEVKNELRAKATRELNALLAAALEEAHIERQDAPHWKTHVRYGTPRMVVEKVTKKAETDLLVLGSRGYSAAAYILLGTVAGDLLRNASCDVLIVPPAERT